MPDIVTLGKPIGNGHPLAAVVTTPEIAASFVTGMEYFNTFGGNPVSARDRARGARRDRATSGCRRTRRDAAAQLLAGLRALDAHPLIGDVRGRGLFLGVELSLDRAGARDRAAAEVKEALKARGVLISTDGPDDNVLKIKPPLVDRAPTTATAFLEALDDALGETENRLS